MGSLFESKQKTTTTQKTKIPSNFQNLMNRTIQFANEGLDTPFEAYNAPRIADLSQNEQAGIASAGANAGMYQDLINMAGMNNAAMQLQGGVPTQGDLDQFMNPYVDYVLGNTLGRLNETSDRNMTQIGSMAGMAGAFGGSRHGVLEGANLAELLKSTQEASANTYSDAFDKGMGNWFNSQNLRRGTISDALNIAQGGQQYNMGDINALMSTGLTERTRNQSVLDFAYSEFMREQQDPFTKAGFAGSVMSQYPTDLFTRTGVSETSNTPSPFSQIAGIGMAAAGMMTGNPAALAGLGAGSQSLGSNPGLQMLSSSKTNSYMNPTDPMKVGITPVAGGQYGNFYSKGLQGFARGGKVRGYQEGGGVEDITSQTNPNDIIGALIREIEEKENANRIRILPDNMEAYTRHEETPRSTPDILGKGYLPAQVYDLLAPLFEGEDRYIKETPRKPGGKAEKRTQKFLNDQQEFLTRSSRNRAGLEHRLNKQYVNPNEKLPPEAIEALQNLLQEKFNTVPLEQGYAKGGKVKADKDGVYRAGSGGWFDDIMSVISPAYMLFDQNESGTPESRQEALEARQAGRIDQGQVQPSTQKAPFNWEAFIQRQGLQNFMTPKFPNSATPRLPAQGPQLGQYVQALQSKLSGVNAGSGTPRTAGSMPGYANGGPIVISGNKKTRQPAPGSRLWETFGLTHDKSPEDITYLLDEIPDEEWTPTDQTIFDGIRKPIEKDRRRAMRLALQKHETAAKEFNNPNYFANTFKGRKGSHAFGLGQWQPETWNEMATKYNRKNKDKIRLMSQDDVKEDRLPTREEQNKIWPLWENEIVKGHGKDYGRAFAEHQLGASDLAILEKYPDDTRMRDIPFSPKKYGTKGGPRIAENVSATKETKGQYLTRLNNMINEGEQWDLDRQIANGGNPTDIMAATPMDQSAVASERAHNFGPIPEDRIREIMRKRGDSVFTGVQPNGLTSRIRRGPDLGGTLSPLETVMGGPLSVPAEEDYLKQLIPGLIEKRELETPSEFTKGGISPFSGGGYVKGYAKGNLIRMPDGSYRTKEGEEIENGQTRYLDAVNRARKGMGLNPLDSLVPSASFGDSAREAGQRSDQAYEDARDILTSPSRAKSRVGKGVEQGTRFLGALVPGAAELVGRTTQGGLNAMSYLFDDMVPEGQPNGVKAPAPKGPFGDLNMGIPNYGQDAPTTAADFNTGLEAGEPDEPVIQAANQEIDRGDALNDALREMIMGEIEARKNRTERDPNQLFGMNVNMPLVKMGLNILANSGYPNSAGEAIGKGVLGVLEDEDKTALDKQKRDNDKLKELINLRYMQGMVESMDPNVKLQLQKEKSAQEAAMMKFKSDYEFQQWLSKQNYSEDMQKRLIKFRAETQAQFNNPFADLGEGRTDLSGE